ncbi:hypothetical protein Tco_1469107 [Tanacetum coccineum]
MDDTQQTANMDDDQDIDKMKKLMEIVLDEEEIAVDAIPLATKPPIIKEDLETLWKLVRARFKSTKLVEDLDLMLCSDLKTMFKPETADAIWRNQLVNTAGIKLMLLRELMLLVEKVNTASVQELMLLKDYNCWKSLCCQKIRFEDKDCYL